MDGNGNVVAVNTFAETGLLSRHTSTGSVFYAFDERGNVAQRLSPSGSVLSSDLYDGFGARQTTDATGDPFGFSGQYGCYTDGATGLVLMTHRYYDPATGRFLTRDPLDYDGGINLYAYTRNNPINWADPSGTDPTGFVPRDPDLKPPHGVRWQEPLPWPEPTYPASNGRPWDYTVFNYSIGVPWLSFNGQYEQDRYGNWYVGNGGGFGTPGVSFSLVEGMLDTKDAPSPQYLSDWLRGGGANLNASFGLSIGKTWSVDSYNNLVSATEVGIGTPALGGNAIWTSQISKSGCK